MGWNWAFCVLCVDLCWLWRHLTGQLTVDIVIPPDGKVRIQRIVSFRQFFLRLYHNNHRPWVQPLWCLLRVEILVSPTPWAIPENLHKSNTSSLVHVTPDSFLFDLQNHSMTYESLSRSQNGTKGRPPLSTWILFSCSFRINCSSQ